MMASSDPAPMFGLGETHFKLHRRANFSGIKNRASWTNTTTAQVYVYCGGAPLMVEVTHLQSRSLTVLLAAGCKGCQRVDLEPFRTGEFCSGCGEPASLGSARSKNALFSEPRTHGVKWASNRDFSLMIEEILKGGGMDGLAASMAGSVLSAALDRYISSTFALVYNVDDFKQIWTSGPMPELGAELAQLSIDCQSYFV